MPSGYMPGVTPGLFLQQGRYNNGLNPYDYDPNNVVDPYQAIALQQQMAKQIFQMQNPRLALPQQFGQALGGMAQQLMRPQGGGGQPGQGGSQQAPTPSGQAVQQKYNQLRQQGMDAGQALYSAADAAEDPQFGEEGQKVALKYRETAVEKLKYDPNLKQKAELEAQYKPAENLVLPNGKKVAASPGTPEYKAYINAGGLRAADMGSLTPGSLHEFKKGGVYNTAQVDSQGNIDTSKPVAKSVQPIQYGATVSGDDAKGAWPGGPKTFDNAGADKVTHDLTNRSIATKNFIDAIDKLNATATPESVGKPGDVSEIVNNTRASINTFAGMLGMSSNPADYKWSGVNGKLIDQMRKNGIDAEKVKSLMLASAMLKEATEGDKNATDANRKYSIEMRMKELGEDSSDIEALKATLKQNRDMSISQLNNEFEGKPNVMSKPPWLVQELGKGKSGHQGNAPASAIAHLKAHPELKEAFQAKYGYLP